MSSSSSSGLRGMFGGSSSSRRRGRRDVLKATQMDPLVEATFREHTDYWEHMRRVKACLVCVSMVKPAMTLEAPLGAGANIGSGSAYDYLAAASQHEHEVILPRRRMAAGCNDSNLRRLERNTKREQDIYQKLDETQRYLNASMARSVLKSLRWYTEVHHINECREMRRVRDLLGEVNRLERRLSQTDSENEVWSCARELETAVEAFEEKANQVVAEYFNCFDDRLAQHRQLRQHGLRVLWRYHKDCAKIIDDALHIQSPKHPTNGASQPIPTDDSPRR